MTANSCAQEGCARRVCKKGAQEGVTANVTVQINTQNYGSRLVAQLWVTPFLRAPTLRVTNYGSRPGGQPPQNYGSRILNHSESFCSIEVRAILFQCVLCQPHYPPVEIPRFTLHSVSCRAPALCQLQRPQIETPRPNTIWISSRGSSSTPYPPKTRQLMEHYLVQTPPF